jgi:hypothetical protein
LKNGFDYLFFIAQDIIAPPFVIERLLSHKKDIVSGLYFLKGAPYTPVAFRCDGDVNAKGTYKYVERYAEGLGKVGYVGMDCILIKVKVLEKMKPPWFELLGESSTEDAYFCRKANHYGYDIFVDFGMKLGHLGKRQIFSEATFKQHCRDYFIEVKNEK